MGFDLDAVRRDFPVLQRTLETPTGQRPLVYMDHGASTHAPTPVLEAVHDLHTQHYANIHRGHHTLSQESSRLFEDASDTFARFIGAELDHGCFAMVQNTTAALDLAAHVMQDVPGKTLTTLVEHHSNDLPHRRRGEVVHAQVDADGYVDLADVDTQLRRHEVKLLTVTGCSNVTGVLPPIHDLARVAHEHDARILVDAAQLYAHAPIDVRAPDHPEHIDFLAAAGHKAYAPFGGAWLYGPRDRMDDAPPAVPGGGTVDWVTESDAWFTKSPDRHMGGTPNITGVVAFAAATEYLAGIGMDTVREHERELIDQALQGFQALADDHGVTLFGPKRTQDKAGVFSFDVPGMRHEKVSALLDKHYGIATRNGCFCAHPLLHRLLGLEDTSKWTDALSRGESVPLPGAVRATVGLYNSADDVTLLMEALGAIARGEVDHADVEPASAGGIVEVS